MDWVSSTLNVLSTRFNAMERRIIIRVLISPRNRYRDCLRALRTKDSVILTSHKLPNNELFLLTQDIVSLQNQLFCLISCKTKLTH